MTDEDAAAAPEPGPVAPVRRVRLGRVVAVVAVIAAVVVGGHSSTLLQIEPGPAPELTRELVDDAANPALATGGQLHFTTVQATRLSWFGVLRCKFTGCVTIMAPGQSNTQLAHQAAEQMTESHADAEAYARRFVGTGAAYPEAPLQVSTGAVGGPSAGLMLTLADIAALTAGDLTGGQVIAGTGTVTSDGQVGSISGIADKVAGAQRVGATVFLAPSRQAPDAAAAAPAGMTVVPVATVTDAVSWLCAHGGAQSTACR